jgi:CheY-like chemotaxis protein
MLMISWPAYIVPVANALNYRPETGLQRKSKGRQFVAPGARLLVVDDIDSNLIVTEGLLAIYKSHVDTCTNGADAILKVQREHYDLVFMDHMMPEMDGIETTRNIRSLEGDYFKNLPIIALTANAIIGMREIFLSNGFNDYLSKPIEISRLDDILTTWIPVEKQKQDTEKQEPKEEQEIFPEGFLAENVDIDAGKTRYGEKLYFEVLRSYCIHTPDLIKKLRHLKDMTLSGKTIKEYAIIVHGLKGATFGICADTVAALAESLEHAAKNGDMQYITENNDPFIETVENILKNLNELLALFPKQTDKKPFCPKPDPVFLNELINACRHYKTTLMDEILDKLEAYEYETGGDLVTWLREQVDNLEYETICKKLEALV